jgi:hypothetical protein
VGSGVGAGSVGKFRFQKSEVSSVPDTPPSFLHPLPDGSSIITVAEDQPINSVVTSLSASDEEGDSVTFFLIGHYENQFHIDGSDVVLNATLDFEVEPSIRLTVV